MDTSTTEIRPASAARDAWQAAVARSFRNPDRKRLVAGLFGLLLALLSPGRADAQQPLTKDQFVGTWQLVSAINILPDGRKIMPFGEHATGMLIFDRSGNFSWLLLSPDIPKYASNNRTVGTAEEFKAAALGSLGYFGTYEVDAAGMLVTRVQASSYANFNGATLKRTPRIDGTQLTLINAAGASGGSAETSWRRLP